MSYERTGLGIDPIVAQTASSSCPAGQTRAFSTQPCQPICSTYQCPTGQTRVNHTHVNVGTAAQTSMNERRTLEARGCTRAPCSNGPQLIDGSSSIIPYCCPPGVVSPPPSPAIVEARAPASVVSLSPWVRPYAWLALGAAGVGLIWWWKSRSR